MGVKNAVTRRSTAADVRHRMFATVPAPVGSPIHRHMLGEVPRPAGEGSCAAQQMPTCPVCGHVTALWRLWQLPAPAGLAGEGNVLHCSKAGCRVQGV